MKNSTAQAFDNDDLRVPNQTLGIFSISILSLFLELLMIRWIGTEIRIFAYLQNTVLVACFLGLGLGMFTSSKPIVIKQSLIPLTFLLLLMAIPITRSALGSTSDMLSVLGDLVIWFNAVTTDFKTTLLFLITGLALSYFTLALIVDIFVPIGRILGRLMNTHANPIWAYSVNIFGSILGTWLFLFLSFAYQPPFTWFLVTGILTAIFILWTNNDKEINLALVAIIIFLAWFASQTPGAISSAWSPYQKLVLRENGGNDIGDYIIDVNNVAYQGMINLNVDNVSANPSTYPPELAGLSQYDIPYLLYPNPTSALLVGAGSGNDAAGALRNHVKDITAVEIDPAIIAYGKKFHPERPYASPNVQIINDDARSFFATTNEKYDVISFGLLDSHTTTAMTNARLDHYVYTKESITQAKSRLADGGIMVLTFEARKPYIADRIELVLEEVFHQPPLVFIIPGSSYGWGGMMFVTGDMETVQKQLDQNQRLSNYIKLQQETYPIHLPRTTKVVIDDWPYIYLESAKIPTLYYLLIGLMAFVFMRSSRKWQAKINITFVNRTFWHFFFLGSAFLLLEVQNISKASVVLGNTWQVNAVIISSILGMALLANWIAYKFPGLPLSTVYFLLVGTALGLYFIDLARFGFLPYATKAVIVSSLISLPMLFSGIVFVRSFAVAPDKSNALGANLLGALVGALLQSITFIVGIKALLLIVAGFYLLSLITKPKLNQSQLELAQIK
jgi:spermidine synthase